MMICELRQGVRHMDITDRHTQIEFAHSMKQSVNWYPVASVIRVVLDNLSTHKVTSWYEAFPAEQAQLGTETGAPLHAQAWQLAIHR
jgi:hypothetical protein